MNKAPTLPSDHNSQPVDHNHNDGNHPEASDDQGSAIINHDHVQLARAAAEGDIRARKTVNELVHNIIAYQTDRFCKRFCRENQYLYVCTLPYPWGSPPRDAPLCEWGNATYAWMLEDLTNPKRLRQYEGKHGARVNDYLYRIANSLPFYERWKDWRFGRKVHVPTYIQDLSPYASTVFLSLRSGDNIASIAQKLARPEQEIEALCHYFNQQEPPAFIKSAPCCVPERLNSIL
jgi:hypothetical protein